MENDKVISEVLSVANLFELTKRALDKIGLEVLAPLSDDEKNELISSILLAEIRS